MADTPAVYDHYRPADADFDAATDSGASPDDDTATDASERTVYRVVGVDDDRVTLLRLTDAEGNREATGELRYVTRPELESDFVSAGDPDPRWAWPDYLGALFVVLGLGMVVYPETDPVSGAVMLLAGAYMLWRRQSWRR